MSETLTWVVRNGLDDTIDDDDLDDLSVDIPLRLIQENDFDTSEDVRIVPPEIFAVVERDAKQAAQLQLEEETSSLAHNVVSVVENHCVHSFLLRSDGTLLEETVLEDSSVEDLDKTIEVQEGQEVLLTKKRHKKAKKLLGKLKGGNNTRGMRAVLLTPEKPIVTPEAHVDPNNVWGYEKFETDKKHKGLQQAPPFEDDNSRTCSCSAFEYPSHTPFPVAPLESSFRITETDSVVSTLSRGHTGDNSVRHVNAVETRRQSTHGKASSPNNAKETKRPRKEQTDTSSPRTVLAHESMKCISTREKPSTTVSDSGEVELIVEKPTHKAAREVEISSKGAPHDSYKKPKPVAGKDSRRGLLKFSSRTSLRTVEAAQEAAKSASPSVQHKSRFPRILRNLSSQANTAETPRQAEGYARGGKSNGRKSKEPKDKRATTVRKDTRQHKKLSALVRQWDAAARQTSVAPEVEDDATTDRKQEVDITAYESLQCCTSQSNQRIPHRPGVSRMMLTSEFEYTTSESGPFYSELDTPDTSRVEADVCSCLDNLLLANVRYRDESSPKTKT